MGINTLMGWAFIIAAFVLIFNDEAEVSIWGFIILAKLCWVHEDIKKQEKE